MLCIEKKGYINESVDPSRGRIKFRQYLKNKRHRYGIKIFKLCSGDYYTCQYKVYAGKEMEAEKALSTKVVLEPHGTLSTFWTSSFCR